MRAEEHGIERLREEARKSIPLCSNCHAAVESGISTLPRWPKWGGLG